MNFILNAAISVVFVALASGATRLVEGHWSAPGWFALWFFSGMGTCYFADWRSKRRLRRVMIAILEAVDELQPNAYGVTIHEWVEKRLGKSVALGLIYRAIGILAETETVFTRHADPTPERGNRPKLFVTLSPMGEGILAALDTERSRKGQHGPNKKDSFGSKGAR